MLRNRIIHFTNGKYSNSKKECIRYMDFTSNIKVININDSKEIKMTCTLIDINKCEAAQLAIKKAIKDRDVSHFDILFPNESAKGYGKKKPFLSCLDNGIFFDYASSGVELIKNIHQILNKINKLFLDQLLDDKNDKDQLNKKTEIVFNDHKIAYSIYDAFYKNNIEK